MSWSSKRKSKYILSLFVLFSIIGLYFAFNIFYTAPTCLDGKLNQREDGIDCGGPCELVCSFNTLAPIVKWSRIVETMPGVYAAVVFVENANIRAEALNVPYTIKLYDEEGFLIKEQSGGIYIPSNKNFPIFKGNLETGNRIPSRLSFEFTQNINWLEEESQDPTFSVLNVQYVEKNNSPRVLATLQNKSVQNIEDLELVVLLYDIEGNLINSSKTLFDNLKKNSSEQVIFTWPQLFDREVIKIDVIPVSKTN